MKTLSCLLLCLLACRGVLHAQNSVQNSVANVPDWQKAAGGAMSFEVASIHEDKEAFKPPSFALSTDEWFNDPNGRFHADFALPTYIQFAYKIWLTGEERREVFGKFPEWVQSTRFSIEATAPLHATKDQYRLMMQSLLAERFGLKLHFEQKEMPVLAMVLVKPGTPGPRLTPHEQGQACDETPKPETFPQQCYGYMARPSKDGMWLAGSPATSMNLLANFIGSLAEGAGEIGRPVVDQTGLTGLWDYTLEALNPAKVKAQDPAANGPTMLEAVRDQLGIKLKPTRAVVSLPVIDTLTRPTEN
ncbi:TIGR03435 family protein [Terriglobus albidus]|uniref:TIGR03435 family protein n=1 Tax=Terriglobus albidus TaxID=1592106 RepID=UPI0021DF44EC|nr:TIGR03435 family protein [Terriglobus albidus]